MIPLLPVDVALLLWVALLLPDGGRAACERTSVRQIEPGERVVCIGGEVDADPSRTLGLSVTCENDRPIIGNLSWLTHLRAFTIEKCSLEELPTLGGPLRNLTARGGRLGGLGSLTSSARELERLDLSDNAISELPSYPFCGLVRLHVLNLSGNALQDLTRLGLEERKLFPCVPELRTLDLSRNRLRHLPDETLSSLRRLHELHLEDNLITQASPYALIGLQRLRMLDLSSNRLNELHPHFFQHCAELREIRLAANGLAGFPAALFRPLTRLERLDASRNAIAELGMLEDAFRGGMRELELSGNRVRRIERPLRTLDSLRILRLQGNSLEYVAEGALSPLSELRALELSDNVLRFVEAGTFAGLTTLEELNLARNRLELLDADAFANLTALQKLDMSENALAAFPAALARLERLQELDLRSNAISGALQLDGLRVLEKLDMRSNLLSELSRGAFRDQLSLRWLDLSANRLGRLEHGVFDDASELQRIDLHGNRLRDINGLFMNLQQLRWLDVSRNRITWFDWALVPTGLLHLDMHDNRVDVLGNYYELESVLQLRTLDASSNRITEVNAATFPNRLETASLRNNSLRIVHPFTFMSKINLTRVDLRQNRLQNLDINALRLLSVSPQRELPVFFLSENPLKCDCTMEWLQRINHLDETRQYPQVVDLEQVSCHMTFPERRMPLSEARSQDFLCRYRSHCFALCHCCEFDACDCEMVCPENCTCYADQTWNTNIVECSSRGYASVPSRIPMDVTELYLDGNDMSGADSHSFIGRKNMQVLHLNGSNVHMIRERTFNGLQALEVLRLEHNYIAAIHGHEFANVTKLRELYLSYNRLATLARGSFAHLHHLLLLHLDHNRLVRLDGAWPLAPQLSDLRLAANTWNCDCQLRERLATAADREKVRCGSNGPFLLELNASCTSDNPTEGGAPSSYRGASESSHYVPVAVAAPLLVVLALGAVLACAYGSELRVWLYSRYGVRLRRDPEEPDKPFDAFLSYSKKDEAFVSQMLAPELAAEHRLCLQREAADCSRCTVVVVSEHYLKSERCLRELKAIRHHRRLVVVLLDKVRLSELEPEAKACLRAASATVRWGDRRFWEKLRYAMPEPRLMPDSNASSLRRSSLNHSVKLV